MEELIEKAKQLVADLEDAADREDRDEQLSMLDQAETDATELSREIKAAWNSLLR